MSPERQIYLLDPQKLDPETIAVTFAKTSRSPESFRDIAAGLTAEKSAEFHEKWVVGFGHASVAEHAVLHLAIEGVSRLAVETIESNRLASYTEKSTRYQKWSPEDFYTPPEIASAGPELLAQYQAACRALFEAYQQALSAARASVERDFPRQPGESDAAWERRTRSEYVDACRFLLPAAATANLGMTINARALEHALVKMLSHPLEEVRQIGAEIKAVALTQVPTLLKYTAPSDYLIATGAALTDQVVTPGQSQPGDWCRLVSFTPDGENQVLAAALYRYSGVNYAQASAYVAGLDAAGREELAATLLGRLTRFDTPLRELEYAQYLFDVMVDQGAYFELKRHRMMTQSAQALTPRLGYAVPARLTRAGVEPLYRAAMEQAAQTYEALARVNPQAASYVVPNGCNRRVLLSMNLRSADHFVSLRAAPNAHFSMRRLALRTAEEIRAVTPLLGRYMRLPPGETWQGVEERYFTQV